MLLTRPQASSIIAVAPEAGRYSGPEPGRRQRLHRRCCRRPCAHRPSPVYGSRMRTISKALAYLDRSPKAHAQAGAQRPHPVDTTRRQQPPVLGRYAECCSHRRFDVQAGLALLPAGPGRSGPSGSTSGTVPPAGLCSQGWRSRGVERHPFTFASAPPLATPP